MRQVERAARVTRRVESAAGIFVIGTGIAAAVWAPQITAKAGFALVAAGAGFVVLYLRRHAMRPLPMDLAFDASRTAFRDALVHGERLLRSVWLWYLLPLMIGPVVLIVGWSAEQGRSLRSVLGFLGVLVIMSALGVADEPRRGQPAVAPDRGVGQDQRARVTVTKEPLYHETARGRIGIPAWWFGAPFIAFAYVLATPRFLPDLVAVPAACRATWRRRSAGSSVFYSASP